MEIMYAQLADQSKLYISFQLWPLPGTCRRHPCFGYQFYHITMLLAMDHLHEDYKLDKAITDI